MTDTKHTPLKPCPFCGGKADIAAFTIVCLDCEAEGPCDGEADGWNKRTDDDLVKALEQARYKLLDANPNLSADTLFEVITAAFKVVDAALEKAGAKGRVMPIRPENAENAKLIEALQEAIKYSMPEHVKAMGQAALDKAKGGAA